MEAGEAEAGAAVAAQAGLVVLEVAVLAAVVQAVAGNQAGFAQ